MRRVVIMVTILAGLLGCSNSGWSWLHFYPVAEEPQAPTTEQSATTQPIEPEAPAADLASQPAEETEYEVIGQPEVVEALMLQVNDQIITISEVLHPIADQLRALPSAEGEQAWRARAAQLITNNMRRQVTEAMVLAEAERDMEPQQRAQVEAEMESMLRDMIAEAGGSRAALEAELLQQGSSVDEYMTVQRRQLVSGLYLRRMFVPQLSTTRRELYDYYRENIDQFTDEAQVRMQILAVPYSRFDGGDAHAQARAAAEAALQRARAGEDFSQLVTEVSTGWRADQGGVMDPMAPGSLRESAVEDAAFHQPVGAVSEVIEGETGCFLVKTLELEPGRVVPFEQAQTEIDQTLRDQQYERLMTEYLDQLYAEATLTEADQFQQRLLDRAAALYYRP